MFRNFEINKAASSFLFFRVPLEFKEEGYASFLVASTRGTRALLFLMILIVVLLVDVPCKF